jgi:hypothetical protein
VLVRDLGMEVAALKNLRSKLIRSRATQARKAKGKAEELDEEEGDAYMEEVPVAEPRRASRASGASEDLRQSEQTYSSSKRPAIAPLKRAKTSAYGDVVMGLQLEDDDFDKHRVTDDDSEEETAPRPKSRQGKTAAKPAPSVAGKGPAGVTAAAVPTVDDDGDEDLFAMVNKSSRRKLRR